MPRIQMLPHLFLFIGFSLLLPGVVQSSIEGEELIDSTASTCEKQIQGIESSCVKYEDEYFESDDYKEELRTNLSTCPLCLLLCRKNNYVNCVKGVISDNYECFEVSKNISQSFFFDLMDSILEMVCQNEAEVMKDINSAEANKPKNLKCEETDYKCDGTPLHRYASPYGTSLDIPGIEYTERGFCRVVLEFLSCMTKETQECYEGISRGLNRFYNHIITSTQCAKYALEGQIEASK